MKNVLNQEGDAIDYSQGSCAGSAAWLLKLTGPLSVIEIGTGYGNQLQIFADLTSKLTCIDAMYDWVPDIVPSHVHSKDSVDKKKLTTWRSHAKPFKNKIQLLIGSSYDEMIYGDQRLAGTELLIIDGCHHPEDAVLQDYLNFRKQLTSPHYVIWDDHNDGDVQRAVEKAKGLLTKEGFSFETKQFGKTLIMFVSK